MVQKLDFTIAIDTREQTPFQFPDVWATKTVTLPTGDYSIIGFEQHVCIERKSKPDLISSIIHNRERFEKELQRLKAYPCRAVVIEADYEDMVLGNYLSEAKPSSVIATIATFQLRYQIAFNFCGPNSGNIYTLQLLRAFYRSVQKMQKRFPMVRSR